MSASISLLRSRRKVVENFDDSGEESDCSVKDAQKKETIEKDARAIAAINMLTVSMVNQLLGQQGLDPFGKSLDSPSIDDDQSWSTPVKPSSRQSITRSIKENTLNKKSRKSVRFTPDCNKTDFTPERSCDAERMELKAVPLSALKMEPKFTPLRRSKLLKAGMLRSLENEQDIESVDNCVPSNDNFDSPLSSRNLPVNTSVQIETIDETCKSAILEVKPNDETPSASQQEPAITTPVCEKAALKKSINPVAFCEKTSCEDNKPATVSRLDGSVHIDESDHVDESVQNDLLCETPIKPKWTHQFDPTSPEHMSPFLKTLLEERAERSQGKELLKSIALLGDSEDQPRLSVLKGVIAFVEVRKADEDRSSGFRWKLNQLGAQVEENFTKKVTHVVFQEGLLSTYRRAKESNVHLVSATWVMACDESSSRVPEDKYPIDEEDKYSMLAPLKKYIRRPKLMSPTLGDDNDEKRLARRLQAIKRRSMKIEGLPSTENEVTEGAVAHSSKTSPDCKTPLLTKKASLGKKSGTTCNDGSSSLMNAWLTGKNKKADVEIDIGNTAKLPVLVELRASSLRTSPRKRTTDVGSSNSPVKQKESLKSFHSHVKAERSSRSSILPVKTISNSRSFELPVKAKSSSKPADSPVKTKSSSKPADSPVKAKSSSRCLDSPVKSKSSSKPADSPVKAKSSSKPADSPVKAKSSSKPADSPVKAKSSSRCLDSPVKAKSSSRCLDSSVKAKSSSRSFDSPKKLKLNSNPTDSTSSTSVSTPVRFKTSSKSSQKRARKDEDFDNESLTPVKKAKSSAKSFDLPKKVKVTCNPTDSTSSTSDATSVCSRTSSKSSPKRSSKKRDFDKESLTTVKSFSHMPTVTEDSESSGRLIRPTSVKTACRSPSTGDVPVERGRTSQKTALPKSAGNVSISSWLSANKASLASPVKRSLSAALKGVTSKPAQRSKSSASSEIGEENKYDSLPGTVVEADLKSPDYNEVPKKKARVDSTPQKKVANGKGKKLSQKLPKSSPKKKATSGTAKVQKSSSGRPCRSKDTMKKISPLGNAATRNGNDKSQTVLTSHFRPLVGSPNEDRKVELISDVTEEPGIKITEDNAVLAQSIEGNRTLQTSPSQHVEGKGIFKPLQCNSLVVGRSEVIDSESSSFCSSTVESKSQSSIAPISAGKSDAQDESQIVCRESEEPQTSTNTTEEQAATAEVCDPPVVSAGLLEEQPTTVDVIEDPRKTSVVFEQVATVDVSEEQPTADDVIEDPRKTSVVFEQVATVDVSEEQPTAVDVIEDPRKTSVVFEQVATVDVSEEQPTADDVIEDPRKTSVVFEQVATVDVSEEQPPSYVSRASENVGGELPTTDVCNESRAIAEVREDGASAEEGLRDAEVTASTGALEEPRISVGVIEAQPASADLLEDKMAIPVMSYEQQSSANVVETSGTSDVGEEQQVVAE